MVAFMAPLAVNIGKRVFSKMRNKDSDVSSTPTQKRTYVLGTIRVLQFALGIAVMGLYVEDCINARKAGKYMDPKWVFALSTGVISAVIAFAFIWSSTFKPHLFFPVDAIIWLLYLVVFGIFGKMYITEDPEGNAGIQRMKNAVWVVLATWFFWKITAIWGGMALWRQKKARSQSVV